MGAPQIIYAVLLGFSIADGFANNGRIRAGKVSFGQTCIRCLLTLGILWWGGFFG